MKVLILRGCTVCDKAAEQNFRDVAATTAAAGEIREVSKAVAGDLIAAKKARPATPEDLKAAARIPEPPKGK